LSVVIGYVTETVSLIVTDTRITFGREPDRYFEDGHKKLINLDQFGFAAGAGASDFLTDLNELLDDPNLNSIDSIETVFNNCYEEHLHKKIYTSSELNSSALLMSWISIIDELPKCRVGILNKEMGDLKFINDNHFFVLYPKEFQDNKDLVKKFEKTFEKEYVFNNDVNEILIRMLKRFDYIQSLSEMTSNIAEYGLFGFNRNGLIKQTDKVVLSASKNDV